MIRVAALLLALSGAGQAQETPVTPEGFLDRVEGRTVTFRMAETGDPVGVEQFLNRTRSIWTRADGSCAIGKVAVRGAKVCFVYDDDPLTDHCWLPFDFAGSLHVRSTSNGEVQRVAGLEKRPLDCRGAPLS